MEELIEYIELLESQSFDGWTPDEENSYLTACDSIKDKTKQQINNLSLGGIMYCFSGITEDKDSIESLVLDYNVSKWLLDNGYYDDNYKLIESKGAAPIFTAIKEAKKQADSEENKILRHILSLRIK